MVGARGLLALPALPRHKRRPMAVKVKICGVTRAEDAAAVVRAGADLAGLVFHRNSPRHLEAAQARVIADRLRGRVRIVALLVDPADDALSEAIAAARPDFIQLHGKETPNRVAEIRARAGIPIIKGMSISDERDFAALAAYEAVADMLLFDAKAPETGATPGRPRRSVRLAIAPWTEVLATVAAQLAVYDAAQCRARD